MREIDLVSIVTPMNNSERYIEATIQSVIHQTYPHWEMIIVDNCSTDRSLLIVDGFMKKDPRIKLLKQDELVGFPSYSRNLGIQYANGKYIAFLDSDDIWLPEKLAVQIEYISHNQDCNIVCTGYEKIDQFGSSKNRVVLPRKIVKYKELLKTNSIGNLTAMYNQEKLGKWYQEAIIHEDYLMWLSMLKGGEVAHGLPTVTAKYRVHSKSLSNNKFKVLLAQWNIYRYHLKLNYYTSIYYFACYAFFGAKKYLI